MSRLRVLLSTLRTGAAVHARRCLRGREVEPELVRESLAASRIVVVMVVKDERARLVHALQHYRALGAEHFVIIDNESTDGTGAALRASDDVSLFTARGSFRRAHYGIDWVNHVLHAHCTGKWVLHVDADEYAVWDASDGPHGPGGLAGLCDALEAQRRPSLQAAMVDMYSDRPSHANAVRAGQDPLEVTALFDSSGYTTYYDPRMGGTWIKGGVRGRHFFSDDVMRSPALNKTPLVRWRWSAAFVQCAHELWPRSLNGGSARPGLGLLHFKFVASAVAKATDDSYRQQHTSEYDAYDEIATRVLVNESTRRYSTPSDLVAAGIIAPVEPSRAPRRRPEEAFRAGLARPRERPQT